jgi:hypothetical protein
VRDFDEIARITFDMMRQQTPTIQRMRDIAMRYEGDYVIPIPEVDTEPRLPPLTPALVGEAVDHMAMRAASVEPMLTFPALDPDKDRGTRSLEFASIRRKAVRATYYKNKWELSRRRAYRQLSAYYTCSMIVLPDFKAELPQIQVRDPLGTFSEFVPEHELRTPEYVAFVTRHSGEHLRYCYPQARSENGGPITAVSTDYQWDVVEWIDRDQTRFGILGPVATDTRNSHVNDHWMARPWMPISPAYPNRLGMCPAVVPGMVTLNKISSRIGNLLGNIDLQAKLMGLDILAQERAIFPDTYAIGRAGGQPHIIGGRWKDGREGDINLLVDVEQVGVVRTDPSQGTQRTIDQLERNFRASTGLVPQMSGESYGAMRTGRGMDSLMGAAVDGRVQELHTIMQAWMPHLNEAILRTYQAYWPDKKQVMFSGWAGDNAVVEFMPSKHFEECYDNAVTYPIPGADVVQQTQILGSLLGTKAISLRSFRSMHPWIPDPEAERRIVSEEEFEDALAQAIVQQLQSGAVPLTVASLIKNFMRKGMDIFEAVDAADKEMQRRQATAAPAPAPESGMIAPPEAMPGMAAGPEGMMQPVAPPEEQIEVPGDVENMRRLMQTMGA